MNIRESYAFKDDAPQGPQGPEGTTAVDMSKAVFLSLRQAAIIMLTGNNTRVTVMSGACDIDGNNVSQDDLPAFIFLKQENRIFCKPEASEKLRATLVKIVAVLEEA